MKRIPATLLWASSLLLLLPAASCTDTLGGDPDTDARAITFTPAAETRAAVETDFPKGSSFSVWGWYGTDDPITNNVFDGETVTKNGGAWTYGGGNRYWIAGMTYNFYGVYPVYPKTSSDNGTTATVDDTGKITVTNFDCSKTGEEAVDLMTATNTRTLSNPIEDDETSAVAMKFQHELARVTFIGRIEPSSIGITGFEPVISSSKLYGMPQIGDFSSVTNPRWNNFKQITTTDNPLVSVTNITPTQEGVIIIEALCFPQNLTAEYYFEITYSTDKGNSTQEVKTQLSSLPVQSWIAGKHYQYSFSISANGRILFDKPTVNAWDEAVGGIIIID